MLMSYWDFCSLMPFYRTGSSCLGKYYIHATSFPVVLCDFEYDVTCQACWENSCAIALGSKPPLVTRIARTGLGRRLTYMQVSFLGTLRTWRSLSSKVLCRFKISSRKQLQQLLNVEWIRDKFFAPCTVNFKIAITVEICTLITVLDPYYHWAARWGNAQSRNTNEPTLYGSTSSPGLFPQRMGGTHFWYGWPSWGFWGVFTGDWDELRPVWVRIGLHTFLCVRLHGIGLKINSDCLTSSQSLARHELLSYRSETVPFSRKTETNIRPGP